MVAHIKTLCDLSVTPYFEMFCYEFWAVLLFFFGAVNIYVVDS